MALQGDPLGGLYWGEAWDPYHGVVGVHLLAYKNVNRSQYKAIFISMVSMVLT